MLNLAFPALDALEAGLARVLSAWLRVLIYGAVSGAAAMFLYRLISPQAAIRAVQARARDSRRRLADSDDPNDALRLALENLGAALQVLRLVVLPALISALPVIVVMAWVGMRFTFAEPAPGSEVAIQVRPASESVLVAGAGDLRRVDGKLEWPAAGQTVSLFDAGGSELGTLPMPALNDVLHQKRGWNRLLGNEAGYVPAGSPVDAIVFDLPRREILPLGPSWLRGWELVFFSATILVSLVLKLRLRIA